MKYRIVSDSASNVMDLPGEIEHISVPLKILIDDEEFVDNRDLDCAVMVGRMEKSAANSSSCPNVYEWKDAFKGADTIFCVTITSGLSGSYNSAVQAAQEYMEENPGVNIYVVDSLSTGAEEHVIVEELRELMEKGLSFEVIRERMVAWNKHTHLLFSLESLHNLAKNGRVSPAVAKIADLLGIRFIGLASDEGKLQQVHIARGERRTLNALLAETERLGYNGKGRMWISHCLNLGAAEKLREMFLEKWPGCTVNIEAMSGLNSYYAERGGLMVGFEDGTIPVFD